MAWLARSFVFRDVDSVIHRLDPRVRLLVAMELFTLALLSDMIWEIALTFSTVMILSMSSKILKRMARTLVFSLGFAVMILVINILVGFSMLDASILALRFISIVSSTSFFFLTTSPDELEHIMRWFRVPTDIVFAFVTAVRFVPVLMLDAIQIMDAQKSRGLEIDRGNPITRIKRITPVLIPLIVSAVVRSGELAEAMESRAYGAIKKPTILNTLQLGRVDKVVSLLSLAIFSAAFYSYLTMGLMINLP